MIAAQHTCKGLLRIILPDDMVTVNLEVMTLTGVHVYKRDSNCIEKRYFPWNEENTPPHSFMKKVRETQRDKFREFLESLLDDLVPNSRPKSLCKCPKLANSQNAQISSKQGTSNSDNTQGRQNINDNISITVRKMQVQAQKCQDCNKYIKN